MLEGTACSKTNSLVFGRFTVLLIYDGLSWRDLRVTEAAATELRGVKALTAANDLDIGDFTLK